MNSCLLIIDLQNDYFPGGSMELVGTEEAAALAGTLLESFRAKGLPVIHVQHLAARPEATFFLPGTCGAEIHRSVAPLDGEPVVTKHFPNSFRETGLLELLRQQNIDRLVICGAMSQMCVDATVRAAFDLGFDCTVAVDACAARGLTFQDRTVVAADVHASFMAALSLVYAKVLPAAEIVAAMA